MIRGLGALQARVGSLGGRGRRCRALHPACENNKVIQETVGASARWVEAPPLLLPPPLAGALLRPLPATSIAAARSRHCDVGRQDLPRQGTGDSPGAGEAARPSQRACCVRHRLLAPAPPPPRLANSTPLKPPFHLLAARPRCWTARRPARRPKTRARAASTSTPRWVCRGDRCAARPPSRPGALRSAASCCGHVPLRMQHGAACHPSILGSA